MARGYTATGKQVKNPLGEHFADAASEVAALLIVCALEMRRHRPAIDGDRVICSRCQNELPHDGHEPCIPRTPRCTETPDMFGDKGGGNGDREPQVRTVRRAG